MILQTLHSKGHTLTKKDSFIANCFLKRLIENVSKIFQKAEKSGTAEKMRKKSRKAEVFRKKRKIWQPWLLPPCVFLIYCFHIRVIHSLFCKIKSIAEDH